MTAGYFIRLQLSLRAYKFGLIVDVVVVDADRVGGVARSVIKAEKAVAHFLAHLKRILDLVGSLGDRGSQTLLCKGDNILCPEEADTLAVGGHIGVFLPRGAFFSAVADLVVEDNASFVTAADDRTLLKSQLFADLFLYGAPALAHIEHRFAYSSVKLEPYFTREELQKRTDEEDKEYRRNGEESLIDISVLLWKPGRRLIGQDGKCEVDGGDHKPFALKADRLFFAFSFHSRPPFRLSPAD